MNWERRERQRKLFSSRILQEKAKPSKLTRLVEWLVNISKLISSILFLLFVILATCVAIRAFIGNYILVEPFNVPQSLANKGLTGQLVASKLIDEIESIKENISQRHVYSNRSLPPIDFRPLWLEKTEMRLPQSGLSITSIIESVRDFFGWPRDYINGELVDQNDSIQMIIRLSGQHYQSVSEKYKNLDLAIHNSVLHLLKFVRPTILALHYNQVGDTANAIDVIKFILLTGSPLDKSIAYNIKGNILSNNCKFDEAINNYKKAVDLDPHFAGGYINWGIALYQKGSYDEAVLIYQKAIDIEPNYAYAFNLLGVIETEKRNYEAAIEKFRKASELEPNLEEIYINWGNVELQQKHFDKSIALYKKALDINPYYAVAYFNWGNVLAEKGDFEGAINQYMSAIESDSTYRGAYNNCGIMLYNLGRYKEAIKMYREATYVSPDSVDVYNNWGNALRELNRLGESIRMYAKAIRLRSNYISAYYNWASALEMRRDYIGAIHKYQQIILIDSLAVGAYNNWGMALANLGRFQEAILKFKKTIEINPNYAWGYCHLGMALWTLGERSETASYFKKAIELDSLSYSGKLAIKMLRELKRTKN